MYACEAKRLSCNATSALCNKCCDLAGRLPNLDAGVAALLDHHRQQLLKALRALRRARPGTAVRADSGRLPSYAAYISVLLATKARS